MTDMPTPPLNRNPAEIARDAFRQLAAKRIAPTPDAYREAYDEISGIASVNGAENILGSLAENIGKRKAELAPFGVRFNRALAERNWEEFGKSLDQLLDKYLDANDGAASAPQPSKNPMPAALALAPSDDTQARMLRDLLTRTLSLAIPSLLDESSELANESAALGKAVKDVRDNAELAELASRLKQFCFKVESARGDRPAPQAAKPAKGLPALAPAAADDQQVALLRDLLGRTLTLAVTSLLQGAPALAEESEALGNSIQNASTANELQEAGARLKQLCFRIELKSGDMAEEHELLLRLFKLLLENVGGLVEDTTWLSGQIATVQNLLAGPISHSALKDATRSLKEVIYKQGVLKNSLTEAKVTVKNMMITFIDRLNAVAATTGDYHEKIDNYSHKISQAKDIGELNVILEDVMRETKIAQNEALRSRDEMIAARQEVQSADTRIQELESKLEQMSELVREDQLTGSLNRRGLDDVFERELARAQRRGAPLCIAMLDLDDFKRLNDTHGHLAGDQVLVHVVRVVKDTLRTMDVIARFGGEEFLILLPDTGIEDAMQTVTRVQRELTKRIFMHNNERLLITFSAGVALHKKDEEQADMIQRADTALYKAKRAGKNRVVAADNF